MPTPAAAPQSLPKPGSVRKQVSRACEWCRARRVKCDLGRPCRACEKSGVACVDERVENPRSLPQALREIARLKERIRDLEAERAEAEAEPETDGTVQASLAAAATVAKTPDLAHPRTIPDSGRWEGICIATARFEHTTSYYGPSSMQYFLGRVGAFLGTAFADPVPPRSMLLTGAHRRMAHPTSPETAAPASDASYMPAAFPALSRVQEEYFLNTFWESYYCAFPVVDEDAFRAHYNSLWEDAGSRGHGPTGRKDSALVDMILALCIQRSSTFLPPALAATALVAGDDPTLAGRWHYRRGRALVVADMECPSITTVQVLLLAVNYLCCASFQNTAHGTLALAVRDATIAGLHQEPPSFLPRAERELRKRIWWTLWAIDTKTCLKLGRPFDVYPASESSVSLPSDAPAIASASALHDPLLSTGGFTWLTFGTHMQAFVSTAANIHRAVSARYDRLLAAHDPPLSSPYRHPAVLEQCAQILASLVAPLHALTDQVPEALRLPRANGANQEPFSFLNGSSVRLDENIPVWLQNQRLYLEMTYHSMAICLYRPFISFYRSGALTVALPLFPTMDRHAARAARHAITFVCVYHKVVRDTTLLAPSWNEYFQWLWNAAVTLVGFLFAYPLSATTTAARDAADCAVAVCDIYAASRFTVAADAASVLRFLLKRVDELFARVAGVPGELQLPSESTAPTPVSNLSGETLLAEAHGDPFTGFPPAGTAVGDGSLSWLDPPQPSGQESLNSFMDWALAVDTFNSCDQLLGPSMDWDASKWQGPR